MINNKIFAIWKTMQPELEIHRQPNAYQKRMLISMKVIEN